MRYEFNNTTYRFTQKDDKITNTLFDKQLEFRNEKLSEEMAFYILLWLKYYRKNCSDYNKLAGSVFYEASYTDKDIKRMISRSKEILKEKYNIIVEQDSPLIIRSDIPLEKLNENLINEIRA